MTRSDTCQHAGCESEPDVVRRDASTEEEYEYCSDHDPLDDPAVEQFFEEVE